MGEIYETTAKYGSIVIGGDDPDVGLGGYLTGGGHSPLSGHYGLAADNVLELEVVTPAGNVRVLNECSHPDLFFAFRGVSTDLVSKPKSLRHCSRSFSSH